MMLSSNSDAGPGLPALPVRVVKAGTGGEKNALGIVPVLLQPTDCVLAITTIGEDVYYVQAPCEWRWLRKCLWICYFPVIAPSIIA